MTENTRDTHEGESIRTYLMVYAALIGLLVLTVIVAFLHLDRLAVIAAMSIACIKAGLVILYFMHVRLSSSLIKFCVFAAFFWLGIMIVLTFSDYLTRTWLPNSEGWSPPVNIPRPE